MIRPPRQLRSRWRKPEGSKKAAELARLLTDGAPREQLETALGRIEFSDEIAPYLDLRGLPYSGPLPTDPLGQIDISFAVPLQGADTRDVHLNVSDYSGSRFRGLPGISILAGKISGCDFFSSKIKESDLSFSGDLSHVSFKDASLSWCNFRDQVLVACDFSGASLRHCGFANVTFVDTDITKANMDDCEFDRCIYVGNSPEPFCAPISPENDSLTEEILRRALLVAREDAEYKDLIPLLAESVDGGYLQKRKELYGGRKALLEELLDRAKDEILE